MKNELVSEKEIEIKILNKKYIDYLSLLKDIGAECIFDDKISTVFFTSKDEKRFVRFRWYGKSNIVHLDIKNPEDTELQVAKIFREERMAISLDSMNFFRKAMKALDLGEGKHSVKHRISYKIDDCRVEFDQPISSKIPPFIEIEGPSENSIILVAKKLGFSKEEFSKTSYWDLMRAYDE